MLRGQITIVSDSTGTHLTNTMKEMTKPDAIFLVHALGKMLGLEAFDYRVLTLAESSHVLDDAKVGKSVVTIDVAELKKQLSEEQNEG